MIGRSGMAHPASAHWARGNALARLRPAAVSEIRTMGGLRIATEHRSPTGLQFVVVPESD